jgi:tetratricopeptide (TPR) repeat protein
MKRAALLITLSLAAGSPVLWAVPSDAFPQTPTTGEGPSDEQAKKIYNEGLEALKEADALDASARKATGPKREKANQKAQDAYAKARDTFQEATLTAPQMPEAWNSLGYTQRKLGSYVAALTSYEQALKLRPGYPEALEYRGEAYLGLNRVDDAKQAYLDLFAANRALSEQFLTAMKSWIALRRQSPAGVDPATITELEKWVQERSQIAGQTAALTREGAALSWH